MTSAREGVPLRAHVEQFAKARIPFVFDPGQGLPLFSGDELVEMIDAATYLAVNDYEGRLLCERTGMSLADIARRVDALVLTRGGEGSEIFARGDRLQIPVAQASALTDPTGCGDAYRAGLLYGIAEGWDWERTGRLAANHVVTQESVAALYRKSFGSELW